MRGLCIAMVWITVGCGAEAEGGVNGGGTSTDATFGTVTPNDGSNQAPTGTITSPAEGQIVQLGDLVSFAAVVSDDATAPGQLQLLWQSNLSGLLYEDTPNESGMSTFTTDTLAAGTHTITLVIIDTDGGVGEVTRTLEVNGPPGQPQIVIEPAEPRTGDDLHVSVTADAVDPNRPASALTYQYTWFRDDEASQSTSTVLSHLTREGERWRVEVRASDGTHDGLPASVEVIIGNTPPSCQGVLVDPTGGPTTTDFTCSCVGREDADESDEVADTCTFSDGEVWLADGCTLPADLTAKGMAVTCTVTPHDGDEAGEPVSSTPILVVNTKPTTPTVALSPAEGTVETLFTCDVVADSTDADGDDLSYERTWYVGTFANPGTGSTSVVAQSLVSDEEGTPASGGDEIFCRVQATDGDALSNPVDTLPVALLNTPPSDGTVIITPPSATEADILTCAASGAEDPDNQTLTWIYQWFLVGDDGVHTPIEGATSEVLTGALFDRGDVVTCTATPTDGFSEGEAVESKNLVTIVNSLPTLEGASLTPPTVDVFGAFTCEHFGWTDLDDDPVEVAYTWLSVDADVLTPLSGKVEATLEAATLAPGATVRCQVTPKNGEALGEAVQSGDGQVINAPPSLEDVTLSPDAPTVSSTLVCAPSGYADLEGGGPFYNYAWKRNNQDIEGATQSTLSSSFTKGDGIRCVVTPNDGQIDGAPVPSNEVFIGNTTPQIGSVTIAPSFATPCETFTCEVSGLVEPDEGDEVTLAYRWERRDEATDSWTALEATTQTLDASAFAPDDTLRCHVRPTDGAVEEIEGQGLTTVWGTEVQSNQGTVINTPPTVASVSLTPPEPVVGDLMTCEPSGFQDPDCDPLEAYTYVWYVGGEAISDAVGPTLSLTDGISAGAQVQCQAIPDDGYTLGTGKLSNVVTVLNAPPSPVVVTIEAPEGADGPLTCAFQLEPTDAEELTYTWFWQVGDQVEIVGEQTLGEEFVAHCDAVRCRVSVSDGLDAIASNVAETTLPSGDDCDDGNPCTSYGCLPEGGCVNTPNAADCDDQDPCTTGDSCSGGVCSGAVDDCDDGNLCTTDSCNQATGCVHAFNASVCDDQNPCTQDACDLAAGACTNVVLDDGTSCDGDGNGCTTGDSCFAGTCIIGQAVDCEGDPDICKHQVCESLSPHAHICKTVFAEDSVPCEDGLQCTAGDHCNGFGTCVPGGFLDCSAGAGPCQVGTCTEETGCTYWDLADDSPCDADGDGCTEGDNCQAGVCLPGSPVDCDNGQEVCSVGECESTGWDTYDCAYVPVPAGLACGGGDFCIVDQACDGAGACGGGSPRDCEAEVGLSCHTAYCDSEDEVCVPTKAADGASCDDGDTCTVTDACQNGYCYGSGNACHEELLSVAVGGASRPSVADLGFGRYVVHWAGHESEAWGKIYDYIRLNDPYGSREDEEHNVVGDVLTLPDQELTQFTTPTAVAPNGDFLTISWTANGCWCEAYQTCSCDAGNLVARSYDYMGTQLAENLAVEVRTVEFTASGGSSDIQGSMLVEINNTATLALPDGSWGLFKLDQVDTSGTYPVLSPPIAGVEFTPLSATLIPGDPVEILPRIDTSGEQHLTAHRVFDVVALPDTTDFLLLWIKHKKKLGGAKWDQLWMQRFSDLGVAQGAAVQIYEDKMAPANTIERLEVRYVEATGELLVVWDDEQDLEEYRRVRWLWSTVEGEMLGVSEVCALLPAGCPTEAVTDDAIGHQRLGDVGVFSDGGFVITWDDDASDVDGLAVMGRTFEVDGTPTCDTLKLNEEGVGDQFTPGVAVLANDEWVTAFADSFQQIWTRRYDREGVDSVGHLERAANDTKDGAQRQGTGAEGPDGDVLVAWSSPFAGTSDNEIVARLIDDKGLPLNAEVQLNATITGDQVSPDLTTTPDGWIAVWQSEGSGDLLEEVVGRVVGADGHPVGDPFTIPEYTGGDQGHPAIAAGEGSALAVWDTDAHTPGSVWEIAGRLLELTGQPLGDEVILSTGFRALSPTVAAVPDGAGYVVAWESKEGPDWDVVVRRLNAEGQPMGDPVVAHTVTDLDQTSAALAVGPDGFLMVCFTTSYDAQSTLGIGCQRMVTDSLEPIGLELLPYVVGTNQAHPAVAYLADGSWTVAWDTEGVDGDSTGIQFQRYSVVGTPMGQRILANRTWAGPQAIPFLVPLSGPTNASLIGWQQHEDESADVIYRVLPGQ